jgi:hypothetical protein
MFELTTDSADVSSLGESRSGACRCLGDLPSARTFLVHGSQEAHFADQGLRCLPAGICLAKEVGEGLGERAILLGSLPCRWTPASQPRSTGFKLMDDNTVGRAFDLARGGTCRNIDDIRRQLKAEGYSSIAEHLAGPTIKRQLAAAIRGRRDEA